MIISHIRHCHLSPKKFNNISQLLKHIGMQTKKSYIVNIIPIVRLLALTRELGTVITKEIELE